MTERAVVVGAGQSGLLAAGMLAQRGVATTVVERLPAAGGQEPEGRPEREFERQASHAGVEWMLGTLAVRFDGSKLETLGVTGATRLTAGAVVVATGSRPASRGELNIGGDRCAGILPATAAMHLLDAGLLPGRRPVVYGGGGLAAECALKLLHAGAYGVTMVSAETPAVVPDPAVALIAGWRVVRVEGLGRLSSIWIESDAGRASLTADALLLAAGRIPMRNIEGAVSDGTNERVIACHSSADPKRIDDACATARIAVARAIERLESQTTTKREG